MAQVHKKSYKSVPEKKSPNKTEVKKKQNTSKTNNTKSESSQTKINLKRGKLPSNWNSYIESHNLPGTNKKIAQKFPKSLIVTPTNTSHNVKVLEQNTGQQDPKIMGTCIAIDCEMVGINEGGKDNMLARVSLVDENNRVVYDTFVKPTQDVVDYRTSVSGVRPSDMVNGQDFKTVQAKVHALLKGKILVGHAVSNDLKVLYLSHNKKKIRDTSKFKVFREETKGRTPSLKFLALHYLGLDIQHGEHSSVEDARAAMLLYKKFKNKWEAEIRSYKFYQ